MVIAMRGEHWMCVCACVCGGVDVLLLNVMICE